MKTLSVLRRLKPILGIASVIIGSILHTDAALAMASTSKQAASNEITVYTNALIYTGESDTKFVDTVAVANGRFVYVGDFKNASEFLTSATKTIDLKGKSVIPGLYDSHIHPISGAEGLLFNCNLPDPTNIDMIAAAVKACAKNKPAGSWIQGGRWIPALLGSENPPTKEILDKVAPNNPVILADTTNHNVWANSAAIESANITMPQMKKYSHLIVTKNGQMTGIFKEEAAKLINDSRPARTPKERYQAAETAIKLLNSQGIIGIQDSYATDKDFNAWHQLDRDGKLSAHLAINWGWDMVAGATTEEHRANFLAMTRPDSGNIKTAFAKLTLDGVPPTKTAAMLSPYEHSHNNMGITNLNLERLKEDLLWLDKQGYTTQIHAVGDRAVQMTLNAVEYVRKTNGDSGLHFQSAHACLVAPKDFARFAALNVIPNFSPVFWYPGAVQDGLVAAIGKERATRNCAMRTLINSNAHPTAGSDWPVSDYNPWVAIEAMVTRKNPDGSRPNETLWPEERITLQQALNLYTLNGAKAQYIESDSGSIALGKTADMVVLDKNIFEIPADKISDIKIIKTFFKGREVYSGDPN